MWDLILVKIFFDLNFVSGATLWLFNADQNVDEDFIKKVFVGLMARS